ncbi:MAG: CerR family C-terminal domain-containing protein [Gammaproteobacteria bacterium]|nr:CerR family C-terminal domain-containing protein [Gammaproteobacteria bacterium]
MGRLQPTDPKAATRERLLAASLKAFGHNDYQAVSTRAIVEQAEANISAISYHFGGKQQLYLATARFLAESIHHAMHEGLSEIQAKAVKAPADTCRKLLGELIQLLVYNSLQGELSADAAGFIFREQHDPTAAFDILYHELIEPLQITYASLLAGILGERPEAREIKLITHALMGQIMVFRISQTTILRRLQHDRFDAQDSHELAELITRLTLAAIDSRLKKDNPHD